VSIARSGWAYCHGAETEAVLVQRTLDIEGDAVANPQVSELSWILVDSGEVDPQGFRHVIARDDAPTEFVVPLADRPEHGQNLVARLPSHKRVIAVGSDCPFRAEAGARVGRSLVVTRASIAAATLAFVVVVTPAAGDAQKIVRSHAAPEHGTARTTFTYTYRSTGGDVEGTSEQGDVLYLYGPRGTACTGRIAEEAVGEEPGATKIVLSVNAYRSRDLRTYAIRPASHVGYHDRKPSRRLKRWCRGVYHGYIKFVTEGEDEPATYRTTHGFTFRVG
jgi:hypothetical protein